MLLDKGANIDARDRASLSVVDALREIPAEKAREIIKVIEGIYSESIGQALYQHVRVGIVLVL